MKRILVTLKGYLDSIVLQVISLMSVAPSQQGLFIALTKDKRSAFKWSHVGTLCIVRCQHMGQLVNSSAGLEAHSSCTLPFRVCILLYHVLYHFICIIFIYDILYYFIYDIFSNSLFSIILYMIYYIILIYHFIYIILIYHILYYFILLLFYTISIFFTVAHLKLQCVGLVAMPQVPPGA